MSDPTVDGTGDPLWLAMEVAVYTHTVSDSPFDSVGTCDLAGVADTDVWTPVAGISSLDTAATASQALAASSGDVQHYCFVLPLGRVSYMRNHTRIAASTTPARYVTASLS